MHKISYLTLSPVRSHTAILKFAVLYGLLIGGVVTLLQLLKYHYMIQKLSSDFYLTIVALLFGVLGIWLGHSSKQAVAEIKKEEVARPEENLEPVMKVVEFLPTPLSKRELEVLELMAQGCSNQEIADRLFVSLNTIKTHSTNLYTKLDVKRRTQAVQLAKTLGIIS